MSARKFWCWPAPRERDFIHKTKVKHQKSHSEQMCLSCLLKTPPSFRWWCVSAQKSKEHTQEREQEELFALIKLTTHGFLRGVALCRRRATAAPFFHSAPSPCAHRFAPEHSRQVVMWAIIRLRHAWAPEPKGENEKCVRAPRWRH
jgi:hypothetical protein